MLGTKDKDKIIKQLLESIEFIEFCTHIGCDKFEGKHVSKRTNRLIKNLMSPIGNECRKYISSTHKDYV